MPKPSRSGSTGSPDPQTDGQLEALPDIVLPEDQRPPAAIAEESRDLAVKIVSASAAVVVRTHGIADFDAQSFQTQIQTDLHRRSIKIR